MALEKEDNTASRSGQRGEASLTLGFDGVEFLQGEINIVTLLFERFTALLNLLEEITQLSGFSRIEIVHLDDVPDFAQREAKAFAAENQFEAHPVSGTVYPPPAVSTWLQQAFILVKTDRPGRQVELLGKV